MEKESIDLLKILLPKEWIIRDIQYDYGVDLEIEIVDGLNVNGKRLWIQMKSEENTETKTIKFENYEIEYIPYSIKTKLLKYSLKCGFPLMLFLADLNEKKIYYLSLQDEIRFRLNKVNPSWQNQETVTIKIPKDNLVNRNNIDPDAIFRNDNYDDLREFANQPNFMYEMAELQFLLHKYEERRPSCYEAGEMTGSEVLDLIELLNVQKDIISKGISIAEKYNWAYMDVNKDMETLEYLSAVIINLNNNIGNKAFHFPFCSNFECGSIRISLALNNYKLIYDLFQYRMISFLAVEHPFE
jgi:hypothetical protein